MHWGSNYMHLIENTSKISKKMECLLSSFDALLQYMFAFVRWTEMDVDSSINVKTAWTCLYQSYTSTVTMGNTPINQIKSFISWAMSIYYLTKWKMKFANWIVPWKPIIIVYMKMENSRLEFVDRKTCKYRKRSNQTWVFL